MTGLSSFGGVARLNPVLTQEETPLADVCDKQVTTEYFVMYQSHPIQFNTELQKTESRYSSVSL